MSAAGPERSSSTWLFNAVRLLLKHAHVPYDPYWITTLTTEKLQQRKHYIPFVSVGYCFSQLRQWPCLKQHATLLWLHFSLLL